MYNYIQDNGQVLTETCRGLILNDILKDIKILWVVECEIRYSFVFYTQDCYSSVAWQFLCTGRV
jgi:hypothetical protein